MVTEVFIAAPGAPDWIISNRGAVLSQGYKQGRWRKIGSVDNHGYYAMRTTAGKKHYMHRLVALAFLGPPPPGKHLVRHLNGIKLDNRVENLAWGDDADNKADGIRLGEVRRRTHCQRGHVIEETTHRRCLTCRGAAAERRKSIEISRPKPVD